MTKINPVTCMTAEVTGDVFTIARVRVTNFYATRTQSDGAFDVDLTISTSHSTADRTVRISGFPSTVHVESLALGRVEMAEFEMQAESGVVNQTTAEADRFEALTFAALVRDSNIVIPRGQTRIEAGDEVTAIGRPDSVQAFRTWCPRQNVRRGCRTSWWSVEAIPVPHRSLPRTTWMSASANPGVG